MNSDSFYNLPDLIKAIHELAPSDEMTVKAIMKIMGVNLDTITENEEGSRSGQNSKTKPQEEIKKKPSIESPVNVIPDTRRTLKKPSDQSFPSRLEFIGKSETPEWFNKSIPIDLLSNSGSSTIYPIETLFRSNWTRSILSGALSTYCDFGSIDIDEIVKRIASVETFRNIPKIPYFTMAHGVQVLIDESEALELFHSDQILLKKAISKVAGHDRTQFLEFMGCPLWGVRKEKYEDWSNYRPPSNGSTVLLLTDLGIARSSGITERAGIKDWIGFADLVKKAGCSLVAFVPYPSHRWPRSLGKAMMIIEWDRKTTAITVKEKVRKEMLLRRKNNNA